MSSERPQLTLLESLDLGLVAIQTGEVLFSQFTINQLALTATLVFFTAPFRGESGHRDFVTHVSYAAAKTRNKRASSRQLQKQNPPTDEVYIALARAKQFEPASTPLPLRAKAHWIGSDSADKILLFFHGGGYVKPATTQLELLWDIKHSLSSKFAICLLSYSLAPEAHYPVQLQQAVHLLRYLVVDKAKRPENIILCGDSAGGNLVLGVLSHLLHPHSSITPLELPSPLLGAALISPWGDFSHSAPSYTQNRFKDSIDAPVLQKWSAYFMNGADTDNYNQPFSAPYSWWKDLNGKVRDLLITAGADEVLVDDIKAFADEVKKILPSITTLIAPGEVHDQPFMEPLTGDKNQSQQATLLKAWLEARI